MSGWAERRRVWLPYIDPQAVYSCLCAEENLDTQATIGLTRSYAWEVFLDVSRTIGSK